MAEWAWGSATDTGRHRVMNEDSLLTAGGLFAVADGMGGANAGEVASATALETIAAASPRDLDSLVSIVIEANRIVYEMALADPELRGMGTTVVAVVAMDDGPRLGIVNIGDSRAYLCRDGGLAQLSIDHSLVELLVRRGQLTPAAAAVHPQRNVLLRSLGVDAEVGVDAWEFDAAPGDRVLLCSDGLFNEVTAEDIAYMLTTVTDPQAAAEALVVAANEAGGRDNITCVVLDVRGEPGLVDPPQQRLRRVVDADQTVQTAMGPTGPQVPTGETQIVSVVSTPERTRDLGAVGGAAAAAPFGAAAANPSGPDEVDGPATERVDALVGAETASDDRGDGTVPPGGRRRAAEPAFADSSAGEERSHGGRRVRPLRILAGIFTLLVIAALAVGAVSWWGSNSYFVGTDRNTVSVFQGRPGGVLWVSPKKLFSDDAIELDTLSAADRAAVDDGVVRPTLSEAQDYLAALRKRVDATTTTTTTARPTTTRPTTTAASGATTTPKGATTQRATTAKPATTAQPATTAKPTTARPTTTKAG